MVSPPPSQEDPVLQFFDQAPIENTGGSKTSSLKGFTMQNPSFPSTPSKYHNAGSSVSKLPPPSPRNTLFSEACMILRDDAGTGRSRSPSFHEHLGVLVRLTLDLICHLWEVLEVADLASGAGFVPQESHIRLKLELSDSPPVILRHGIGKAFDRSVVEQRVRGFVA